jgi:hypothetical protein
VASNRPHSREPVPSSTSKPARPASTHLRHRPGPPAMVVVCSRQHPTGRQSQPIRPIRPKSGPHQAPAPHTGHHWEDAVARPQSKAASPLLAGTPSCRSLHPHRLDDLACAATTSHAVAPPHSVATPDVLAELVLTSTPHHAPVNSTQNSRHRTRTPPVQPRRRPTSTRKGPVEARRPRPPP